uniref:Enoyl reductase (ER) domain-containing protein n=1 Tax=Arion vulgaris TaxID=1028688 RepID=A0A0B6ZQ36_9EUPU
MANIINSRNGLCLCHRVLNRSHQLVGAVQYVKNQPCLLRMSSNTAHKMQTWQIHEYGSSEKLTLNTSAHAATIKSPNELLIRIHAASVNPIDVRMLGGYGRSLINILRKRKGLITAGTEFPLTLGRDFSGTVIEAGKAVSKFKAGDEVWGALGAEKHGTHAKYTIVSQDEISKKPDNLSHLEAASMPYVITTTWAALCTIGELKEREAAMKRILVLGGSGGIGTFAIQLAKAWGMHATATCSTDAVDLVTGLGAEVIDYRTKDVWKELHSVDKFDYILDTLGGENTKNALPYLKPRHDSHLITLISPLLSNSDKLGVLPGLLQTAVTAGIETLKGLTSGTSVRWAVFMPNGAALEKVRQMVEAEKIKPIVQQVFPFTEVPAAFKKVSNGHLRGKIVIDALVDS